MLKKFSGAAAAVCSRMSKSVLHRACQILGRASETFLSLNRPIIVKFRTTIKKELGALKFFQSLSSRLYRKLLNIYAD